MYVYGTVRVPLCSCTRTRLHVRKHAQRYESTKVLQLSTTCTRTCTRMCSLTLSPTGAYEYLILQMFAYVASFRERSHLGRAPAAATNDEAAR